MVMTKDVAVSVTQGGDYLRFRLSVPNPIDGGQSDLSAVVDVVPAWHTPALLIVGARFEPLTGLGSEAMAVVVRLAQATEDVVDVLERFAALSGATVDSVLMQAKMEWDL